MRHPFATEIAGGVLDVHVLPSGEIAVYGSAGVTILDRALTIVARVERGAAERVSRIVVLADGRFLAYDPRFTQLFVGARGGAFARVDATDKAKKPRYVSSVVATQFGFVATDTDGVLIARGDEIAFHEEKHVGHGALPFSGGAIVAGHLGYAIIDEHGEITARHERHVRQLPVALDTRLGIATDEGLVVRAPDGTESVWPLATNDGSFVPFGAGVLCCTLEAISYWRDAEELWTFEGEELHTPSVVGERIVISSIASKEASIVDADGNTVASIDLGGTLQTACAFADGIALASRGDSIAWWRPARDADATLVRLEHDGSPNAVTTYETDGLLSADYPMLYRWSASENGPEPRPIETKIPFHTPIVINGSLLTIVGQKRFALGGRYANGEVVSVPPDAKFRLATTPDEAKSVLAVLLARQRDGDLPALDWNAPTQELIGALRNLTPKETVTLQTRALFAPGRLEGNARRAASHVRPAFYAELSNALGCSTRVLHAAIRAGQFPLEPPKKLEGFEYIGAFTTATGSLVVADPCYVHRSKSAFPLSFHVEGREGRWHAYLRPDANERDRTAEIVVVHERGFDAYAADPLGVIGVDAGLAGVFDRSIPKWKDDEPPFEEGILSGLGAVASSGQGDGMYPAFTGSIAGKVVKIRIHFLGSSAEIDRTIAQGASTEARAYTATETFAIGERLVHKKFGAGQVVRDLPGGKIEVLFDEGPRTLVHGLKA